MTLRCLARRATAAPSIAGAVRRTRPSCARSLYTAPTLDNHVGLEQNGIPGLLSREAFKIAYTDYQQYMVDELNQVTGGTRFENQDTKSLVIEFARDPTKAYNFNVASMAFNNHFFFRGINTNPNVQSRPTAAIDKQINKDFTSRETLRETFIATAQAMFGPGFVWLVQTSEGHVGSLRILPTYLAGSPLSGAHYRRQSQDLNTENPDSYQPANKVGAFGGASKQGLGPKKPLGGIDVVPLLCVNTWEHVWLHDYGVKGKKQYLEAWWDKIDWDQAGQSMTIDPRQGQGQGSRQFLYNA